MQPIKMTKDGGVKIVDREDVQEILEAEGWQVVSEEKRRGRKAKAQDEVEE
jgi:transketolase